MRIASIDIGTNTVRLLIGEKGPSGLKKLHIQRIITRLGEGFSQNSGLMIEKAQDRTIKALDEFSRVLKDYEVERTKAVATSVVRESNNGISFKERVKKETGLDIEIISGELEAELTVKGVIGSVELDTDDAVIFDIGGGSTEYIHIIGDKIKSLKSLKIGVVHMTENYLINDISSDSEIAALTQYIDNILDSELGDFGITDPTGISLIGTAGTPTTLAAIEQKLDPYDPSKVNGFILTKDMVVEMLHKLNSMSSSEKLKLPGLERGREDLIVSGTLTVLSTMNKFSQDNLIVSDGGLLEGVLYHLAE